MATTRPVVARCVELRVNLHDTVMKLSRLVFWDLDPRTPYQSQGLRLHFRTKRFQFGTDKFEIRAGIVGRSLRDRSSLNEAENPDE